MPSIELLKNIVNIKDSAEFIRAVEKAFDDESQEYLGQLYNTIIDSIQKVLLIGGDEWRDFVQYNREQGIKYDEFYADRFETIVEAYLINPNLQLTLNKQTNLIHLK